jgi:hypothetical protein
MCDIVRDLPEILEKAFDAVEHSIERRGKPIEFVAPPADRHAFADVAGDNGLRGIADRAKPPIEVAGQCNCADETQKAGRDESCAEQLKIGVVNALDPFAVGSYEETLILAEVDAEPASFVGTLIGIDELDVVHPKFGPPRSQTAIKSVTVRCEHRIHQPLPGCRCLAIGYGLPKLGFAISMELIDERAALIRDRRVKLPSESNMHRDKDESAENGEAQE